MRTLWKTLAALGSLLLPACTHTADTGVLVKVGIDESMLQAGDKFAVYYRTFTLDRDGLGRSPIEAAIAPVPIEQAYNPTVLAFVPKDGREEQPFLVAAAIHDENADVRVMQQFIVTYDPGSWRELWIDLTRSCIDTWCDDDETCSFGSCRSVFQDAAALSEP